MLFYLKIVFTYSIHRPTKRESDMSNQDDLIDDSFEAPVDFEIDGDSGPGSWEDIRQRKIDGDSDIDIIIDVAKNSLSSLGGLMKIGTIVTYFNESGRSVNTKTTSCVYMSGWRRVVDIHGHKAVRYCEVIESPRSLSAKNPGVAGILIEEAN